ncbi:MAG: inositol phosphorylceramide synthase [Chloroflexia bacterium]|nr:inositol phosphorylceramide synthase [Chloroflexia bacterium]
MSNRSGPRLPVEPERGETPASARTRDDARHDQTLDAAPADGKAPQPPPRRRTRVVRRRFARLAAAAKPIWYARPEYLPIRVAIAALLIVVAVFTNRTFLGWGLFATVAVLFVPVTRARSFVGSFIPYAMVWFLFSALRSLADETILARTVNTNVAQFERWLFGGQLPTIVLQERFFDPSHLRWHDYFLTGIHWSYFIVPHALAIRLWQKDPALFRRYLSATTLLLTIGLGLYFLIPSNPPWLAPDPVNSPAAVQVTRIMEPVGVALGGGLYAASYRVIGESNPIAAMPSIHMAITWLLPLVVTRQRRRWRLLATTYGGLMGLALVYLGEHYVVDVIAGIVIAAYSWFTAGVWLRRVAPAIRSRFVRTPRVQEVVPGARI